MVQFKNVCKNLINYQKQPPRGVLQKSCFENFRKINGKPSMVECSDFTTKITFHRKCFSLNFRTGFL